MLDLGIDQQKSEITVNLRGWPRFLNLGTMHRHLLRSRYDATQSTVARQWSEWVGRRFRGAGNVNRALRAANT